MQIIKTACNHKLGTFSYTCSEFNVLELTFQLDSIIYSSISQTQDKYSMHFIKTSLKWINNVISKYKKFNLIINIITTNDSKEFVPLFIYYLGSMCESLKLSLISLTTSISLHDAIKFPKDNIKYLLSNFYHQGYKDNKIPSAPMSYEKYNTIEETVKKNYRI